MKFIFPCYDANFSLGKQSGAINGGTVYLNHLAENLRELNHEAALVENGSELPQADVIIIQSEWYGIAGQMEKIKAYRANGTRVIVILGHFKGGVYFDPANIDADLFVSTWRGEVVDNFKQEVKFFPHGFCTVCDKEGSQRMGDIVWVGNNYPLRDENWLEGLDLTRISGVMPEELGKMYRGAEICPNIHGKFQMGEVSKDPSTLADVPGFAVNERLFHITGSGGFQIADNNPQIKEFFKDDELETASCKEEFHEKIKFYLNNPDSKQSFIKKGRARVMKDHTYKLRIDQLLEWVSSIC